MIKKSLPSSTEGKKTRKTKKAYSQPTSEEAKFFIRNLNAVLARTKELGMGITNKQIANLGDHYIGKNPVLAAHLKRLKGISHLAFLLVFTEFPLYSLFRDFTPQEIHDFAKKRIALRDEGVDVEERFIQKLKSLRDVG